MKIVAYNIIDILNKAINVDNKTKIIIKNIANENEEIKPIKLINNVMIKQLDIGTKYYEDLIEKLQGETLSDVDFMTYDKISFLVSEFNNKQYSPVIKNPRDFLMFTMELSKERYSLFVDIQGRLVNNTGDSNSKTYNVLNSIIDNINKQIIGIEEVLNKKYT